MSHLPVDQLRFLKNQCGENSVTRDLLRDLQRFFTLIQQIRSEIKSDWLTVEEIAKELKISKSIVYRLIRNGQLEAINIAENSSKIASRGLYRIHRIDFDKYIASSRVNTKATDTECSSRSRQFPKVKNHLGL